MSVKEKLKDLPVKPSDDQDIMADISYIRKSCSLVTDALKKGCDVLQMPNGDVVITEIRTVSFQYTWNKEKGKFEKIKSGSRLRRLRRVQSGDEVPARSADSVPYLGGKQASVKEAAPAAQEEKVLEDESV